MWAGHLAARLALLASYNVPNDAHRASRLSEPNTKLKLHKKAANVRKKCVYLLLMSSLQRRRLSSVSRRKRGLRGGWRAVTLGQQQHTT